MNTHVVIMAGGVGSRFWPLSTPEYPKQFIDVLGCGRSLIQLTVDRFAPICPMSNFWVVTNAAYVDIVKKQLPQIPENHILAEPAARNTAPCIAWACSRIAAEDPGAGVAVSPSDAVVLDPEEFRRAITDALDHAASHDAIVTIGIKPSRPETGYGYVEVAAGAAAAHGPSGCAAAPGGILPVSCFREKPSREVAEQYLAAGNYLWNAGIFVLNVRTIDAALHRYRPALAADIDRMAQTGDVAGIFPTCEKISIDYAVMEPASRDGLVCTRPADFGGSDLGNWAALHDRLPRDADGNAAVGNVAFHECRDCVVHAEDASRVVLQGLDGYIVSEKGGRILVCRRSEEQRIREFSE